MNEVFCRSDHSDPARVDRALAAGRLVSLYRGVLAPAGRPVDLGVLVRGAHLVDPDGIVVGEGARSLGWAGNAMSSLRLASRRQLRGNTRYLQFDRRDIPLEFVTDREDLRFTSPEYTAVDLVGSRAGEAVTDVLRLAGDRGPDALAMMWEALASMRGRRGNAERRRILTECEKHPWSEAERELHNFLRLHRITGWTGNHPVRLADTWFLDVAFVAEKVGLEYDSWEFHSTRAAFERDRLKANQLRDAGWTVFQITARMLPDGAQLLGWIEAALARSHSATGSVRRN